MLNNPEKPTDAQERALQISLDNIHFAIQKTLATLKWVEDHNVSERGPFQALPMRHDQRAIDVPQIIFTSHNDTSNPSPIGVRAALVDHLSALLKLQQTQARAFRSRHAALVLQTLTRSAEMGQAALRAHAREKLRVAAVHTGAVPENTLRELQKESDLALNRCVSTLDANPSRASFTLTLKALENAMILLSPVDSGATANALAALQNAGAKRLGRALQDYLAHPSERTGKILAQWIERAMQLGCDSKVTQPAVDALQPKLATPTQPKLPAPNRQAP